MQVKRPSPRARLLWTILLNTAMVLIFNNIFIISDFWTTKLTFTYSEITSRGNKIDFSKTKSEHHHHFGILDYFLLYSNPRKDKDFLHFLLDPPSFGL